MTKVSIVKCENDMERQKGKAAAVSLVKCQNYDGTAIDAALVKTMSLLGGIKKFIKPGDQVLLKINLLTGAAPEDAITTHPAIVRAMIHQVGVAGGTL